MTETELNALQAQCKRGYPKHMIDDSNSLHAECYGAIGWLRHRLLELEADKARLDAVEKNGWTIILYRSGRAAVVTFDDKAGHYSASNVRSAVDAAIKSLEKETPKPK